ncbi:MAG: MotA/TolQ/ExbB proton channel family protein [Endomicrobium sp.]|jgi:biopolymer transport protein ExbB/TolQ|nr:MotA/TolQ/ExbB proton channel family protein [Endomicrobium sp.]
MFDGKGFIDILKMGGPVLCVIFGCSIVSIAIICFKGVEFWVKSKIKRDDFICNLLEKMNKCSVDEVIDYCDLVASPISNVSRLGVIAFKENKNFTEAMEREIMIQTVKLESFTNILATLGSVTVYIGLIGTVFGIISAFHDIAQAGSGGINIVIGGVSEALINTAAGLCVAIPSTVGYNIFSKIINNFVVDMEYCVSEVEEVLKRKINE